MENDDEFLQRIAVKDVPVIDGVQLPFRITDVVNIPSDRTFRAAWTDENPTDTVDVCMVKAAQVHLSRIRQKRDEKLKALDIETMKGKDVQAEKQKLRDLPQTLDLSKAKTPDELQALWPSELK